MSTIGDLYEAARRQRYDMAYRRCTCCNDEKPLTEFYRKGRNYQSRCKECDRAHGKNKRKDKQGNNYYIKNMNTNIQSHIKNKNNVIEHRDFAILCLLAVKDKNGKHLSVGGIIDGLNLPDSHEFLYSEEFKSLKSNIPPLPKEFVEARKSFYAKLVAQKEGAKRRKKMVDNALSHIKSLPADVQSEIIAQLRTNH